MVIERSSRWQSPVDRPATSSPSQLSGRLERYGGQHHGLRSMPRAEPLAEANGQEVATHVDD